MRAAGDIKVLAPSKGRATRTRRVMARLGTLALELVGNGLDRGTQTLRSVALETRRDLDELGLDRMAASVSVLLEALDPRQARKEPLTPVRKPARSLYARVLEPASGAGSAGPAAAAPRPGSDVFASAIAHARALLRIQLVARGSQDYPQGPTPHWVLDPLMRRTLPASTRSVLRGRILVPLVPHGTGGWLVHETGGLGLLNAVTTRDEFEDPRQCWLARALALGPPDRLRKAHARRVLPGVPVGPVVDRAVVATSQGRLDLVLRHALERRVDPFCDEDTPILVGPLMPLRSPRGPTLTFVRDAAGRVAVVNGGLPDDDQETASWILLGTAGEREGRLALTPLLLWKQGPRRAAVRVAATRPPATTSGQRSDPLLDRVQASLTGLLGTGLARGLSSRHEIATLSHELAAANREALARTLRRVAKAPDEEGALLLCEAIHLVACLRDAPHTVEAMEGPLRPPTVAPS